jgi:hypothetical protein
MDNSTLKELALQSAKNAAYRQARVDVSSFQLKAYINATSKMLRAVDAELELYERSACLLEEASHRLELAELKQAKDDLEYAVNVYASWTN